MTDHDLRDLLEERVADLGTRDLSATAWQEGVRRRRRRRAVGVAAVAAVTAAVMGVAALPGLTSDDGPPPGERPAPAGTPDAVVDGIRIWWGPDLDEEAGLPRVGSRLPEQVDLDEQAPEAAGATGPLATAAYAILDEDRVERLLLVGADGNRSLDVSRLEQVAKPNGYRLPPVGATMLSPDGATLAFPQDGAVVLFDVTLGTWREVPVGERSTVGLRWAGARVLLLPNGDGLSVDGTPVDVDPSRLAVYGPWDQALPHGPQVTDASGLSTAQAYGYGARVPTRPGGHVNDPETIVVDDSTAPDALTISGRGDDGRFKDCCPVAGWLDRDTLVYESRSAEPRLVSWDVGTRDFGLVTTVVGLADPSASYVGSYAQLDLEPTDEGEPAATAPDATVDGTQVWWGPAAADEVALPWLEQTVLPRELDLGPGLAPAAAAADGIRAAVAVGRGPRIVLLAPDGTTSELDVSRLEPVTDEAGNGAALLPDRGVAPDGRHVLLVQNSSLEVYDVAAATWTTIDTPDWEAEGASWWRPGVIALRSGATYGVDGRPLGDRDVVEPSLGRDGDWPYGTVARVEGAAAQAMRLVGDVPGGDLADPEAIVVERAGERLALALPQAGRSKGCCPVLGLLDADTVLFRSGPTVLAWRIGTPDVLRVASPSPAGAGWGASVADLS